MFAVYSNLKSCVENMDETIPIDCLLAHFILENHSDIPDMSIGELSEACNTSQASISRFCKRVNGSNFKMLKEDIKEYNDYLNREVSKPLTDQIITRKDYFKVLSDSLDETERLLTKNLLAQAIGWMDKGKSIYFFGSSFSNNVAKDACEKFTRINRLCFSFSAVKSQLSAIDLINDNDVVVFISFSGTNTHINRLYRRIKNKRCKIIWITANRNRECEENREMILPVSNRALGDYETSLIEGVNLRTAVDLTCLYYTNYLRTKS